MFSVGIGKIFRSDARSLLAIPGGLLALYAFLSFQMYPDAPGRLTLAVTDITAYELLILLLLEVVTVLVFRMMIISRRQAALSSQPSSEPATQPPAPESEPSAEEPEKLLPDQVPEPLPLGKMSAKSVKVDVESLRAAFRNTEAKINTRSLDPKTEDVLAKLEAAIAPSVSAGYSIASIEVRMRPSESGGQGEDMPLDAKMRMQAVAR